MAISSGASPTTAITVAADGGININGPVVTLTVAGVAWRGSGLTVGAAWGADPLTVGARWQPAGNTLEEVRWR